MFFFFKLGFDFIFSYISIPTLKELNINFKFKKIIKWKIKGALNLVSAKKLSSGLKKLISIFKKKTKKSLKFIISESREILC